LISFLTIHGKKGKKKGKKGKKGCSTYSEQWIQHLENGISNGVVTLWGEVNSYTVTKKPLKKASWSNF